MINGLDNLNGLGKLTSSGIGSKSAGAESVGGGLSSGSFSDVLSKSIDEVSRLQQDASRAVEDLATGRTENVAGVMTAMEKSDLAFKTLLAIRSKLMEAYDEIKAIQI
jgi:flagellar hook-basal body complex protein FliE